MTGTPGTPDPIAVIQHAHSGGNRPSGFFQQLADSSDIGNCYIRLIGQAGGLRCGGFPSQDESCRDTGFPGHFHIRVDAIAHHQHLLRRAMETIAQFK